MLTIQNAIEKVNRLEFSPINRVLQYENPAFWTDEVLMDTEADYRRFLVLNLLYPNDDIVVNKILDDYWHQHILDTKKYAEDCEEVFGYFLHHYPYFGINGEQDKQNNREGFAITCQLWEETFGEPMVRQCDLTLDKILGVYDAERRDADLNRVYSFPQGCKNGQHCSRTIVPDIRINPAINPRINPQTNPQIRPAVLPEKLPSR